MKISHIFHHFNEFGGAEEHITTLAVHQMARGYDVDIFLVKSADRRNQYYARLVSAGIRVHQWPVWLSRISGDWDTRENILRRSLLLLSPAVYLVTNLLSFLSGHSRGSLRVSIEGRIRTILGSMIDLRREKGLFLFLLAWRCLIDPPDLFHLHSYGAGMEYVLHWIHEHKIPCVYQEHSTPDLTERNWYRLPDGLNLASTIVAVSEKSAQALRDLCGVTGPIHVIPPIVSIDTPDAGKKRTPCRDGKEIQVVTIARLSEEKGLVYLLDAAESILAINPSVKFSIYGEGPLRAHLEDVIRTKKLSDHMVLNGSFSRGALPDIMSKANIFVLPSITEGLPLTLIEAMAWGLPIVATAVGGIPELINDGVTGLLCEPQNSQALTRAILSLINDPQQAANLGAMGQSTLKRSRFSAENVLIQFEEVYLRSMRE